MHRKVKQKHAIKQLLHKSIQKHNLLAAKMFVRKMKGYENKTKISKLEILHKVLFRIHFIWILILWKKIPNLIECQY